MKRISNKKKIKLIIFGGLFVILTFTVLIGLTGVDNASNIITTEENTNINYDIDSDSQLATASTADVLVVNQGQTKDYITRNGFSYTAISPYDFASISASTINAYEIVILEPNWYNYEYLRSGVNRIKSYATSNTIVGIRVAGNRGSKSNIDMYSTDYDRTYTHQYAYFYSSQHPFISGSGFGGHRLYTSHFDSWGSTDHGWLYNYPSNAPYFEKILYNQHGCSMFEYQYSSNLYVVVDTLTSIDGPWGAGNDYVADNYIKFLNYRLTTRGSSGDTTAPSINHPSNIVYSEGSTGHSITWSVSDSNPDTYTIKRDGSTVESGYWSNGNININVDGLSVGSYTYTLDVFDDYENSASDSVVVSVQDNQNPTINTPNDIEYHEDSTGNSIIWSVSDAHADTYSLWKGEELISSNSWTTGDLEFNIDGLTLGTYYYTLVIMDESENSATDTVQVTVVDGTAPSINSPEDINYIEGSTDNCVSWSVSDTYPDIYELYQGEELVETDSWTTGDLEFNIDGLSIGSYEYTLKLMDESDNLSEDTIQITVTDATPPEINSPLDIQYVEDTTENVITWEVEDLNPENYVLYLNENVVQSDLWTTGDLEFNIDGLEAGSYTYQLEIFDTSSNSVSDLVNVEVFDETDPTIDEPTNLEHNESSFGNKIVWQVADNHPNNYIIEKNGEIIETGDWDSGDFELSTDDLEMGIYTYTLTIFDMAENNASDTIQVVIFDETDPIIENLGDFEYAEGTTGNVITWTISDNHPHQYTFYQGKTEIESDSWTTGDLEFNIDGLPVGICDFTLEVTDTSGNMQKATVLVLVRDETSPLINSPADIEYQEGSTSNLIQWTTSDNNPQGYKLHFNDELVEWKAWNGEDLEISIDGLKKGTYNYTLTVIDIAGNSVEDTVEITVVDQNAPLLTLLDDITINETTDTVISWMGNDLYPANYQIFRNEQIIDQGLWTNNAPITTDIVNLTMGVYNYEIVITDSDGYSTSDSVQVTVLDEVCPQLDPLEDIIYDSYNANETITWEVFDKHPSTYEIRFDGDILESGEWNGTEITIELKGMEAGEHSLNLTVVDESGNVQSDLLTIIVPEMEENENADGQSDEANPNEIGMEDYFMIAGFGIVVLAGFVYSKMKK